MQGYDLDELQFVACKIHALNSQWTEEKKANYTKVLYGLELVGRAVRNKSAAQRLHTH